jgi:hypothetical protein
MWHGLLTEEERQCLGGEWEPLWRKKNAVGIWMQLRGVSQARATVDLAKELNLLSEADHRRLLREIGESQTAVDANPAMPARDRPVWNRDTSQLHYRGEIVRRVVSPSRASSICRILDAFQEDGWPERIDDPLPGGPGAQRLRETIRTLNKGLAKIRFRADGTSTGIVWEVADTRATPAPRP